MSLADSVLLEKNDLGLEDDLKKNIEAIEVTTTTTVASSSIIVNQTNFTIHPTVSFDLNEEHPTVSFLNTECKVDLVLVIDTSQSVAEEFQKQLQFAVDLVSLIKYIF